MNGRSLCRSVCVYVVETENHSFFSSLSLAVALIRFVCIRVSAWFHVIVIYLYVVPEVLISLAAEMDEIVLLRIHEATNLNK